MVIGFAAAASQTSIHALGTDRSTDHRIMSVPSMRRCRQQSCHPDKASPSVAITRAVVTVAPTDAEDPMQCFPIFLRTSVCACTLKSGAL